MPKEIDPALRERAVRLVREHRAEYPSNAKAIAAVARQEDVGAESLRRWVLQADIDAGEREGQTSEEHAEIHRLKAENKRLREDVAILKAAARGNSIPATTDHGIHRSAPRRGARGRVDHPRPA